MTENAPMTEAEWLSCDEVEPLLHEIWERHPSLDWNDRKPSLLFCACCGTVSPPLPPEFGRFISILERFADDPSLGSESAEAFRRLEEVIGNTGDASTLVFAIGYGDLGLACCVAGRMLACASGNSEGSPQFEEIVNREYRRQVQCVRDIFGNPFRPTAVDSGWFTPEVVTLAQTIYRDRTFHRMVELADTLEAGGCSNWDILYHCRGSGPHVRGCWVLDLLLGKDIFRPMR